MTLLYNKVYSMVLIKTYLLMMQDNLFMHVKQGLKNVIKFNLKDKLNSFPWV